MKNHNLAFTDTETTGLDVEQHEIIEIACILARQIPNLERGNKLEVIDEFELKIKPEHIETADPESLEINGYKEEDWKDAMTLQEAMEIYGEKTKDSDLVAHNVTSDWNFLDRAFHKTGVQNKMHYHRIDTLSIAFAKLYDNPDVQKFSLKALCEYLGIKNEKEHSALSDTRAMFEMYKKVMNIND